MTGLTPARPFHLAFPVDDLEAAERFYGELLGCRVGRRSADWIDFEFGGHQITAHRTHAAGDPDRNLVDGDRVPVRHFGLVLEWGSWEQLGRRLDEGGARFLIEPRVRFAGQPGEQGTFFVLDPAGNALEFKAFRREGDLFRTA